MKKVFAFITLGMLATGLAITSCNQADSTGTASSAGEVVKADSATLIKRGAYLVTAMVCDDCHSPKRMGPNGPELIPDRRLSGFQEGTPIAKFDTSSISKGWVSFNGDLTMAVGPWGASFSANITPDSTGIGSWPEEQFFRAIREGKSKGLANNRMLLPPMPWSNFSKLSDEDLRAIFYYLKSLKPVKNVVPAPKALKDL